MKNDSNNRVPANKHYLSRRVGWIVFIFMLGIGGYLALPSNYYLRRALIHLLPKIDQYPIFENRVVKAGSPRPWELSEAYNTKSIPERYLPRFEELGTVAYVIIQDNRLLFEQYWEDYSPESHSNSFSMAKSIVSLAIGCAIDDGFIRDVDQPVSDFFPEFKGYDGKALTLRHLLTMSAGVDFDEAYSSPFSPTTQLYYGDDLQEIAFGMKEIDEPGVNFIYQSGVTQLLALSWRRLPARNSAIMYPANYGLRCTPRKAPFGASTGRTAWKKPIAVSTVTPVISPASDNYYSTTANGMTGN